MTLNPTGYNLFTGLYPGFLFVGYKFMYYEIAHYSHVKIILICQDMETCLC